MSFRENGEKGSGMRDNASGAGCKADGKEENEPGTDAENSGTAGAQRGLWTKRGVQVAASVAAVLVVTGIVLGVASAVRGSVPADARIPRPPAKNDAFVEDINGAGQDQQTAILQSSGQGHRTQAGRHRHGDRHQRR